MKIDAQQTGIRDLGITKQDFGSGNNVQAPAPPSQPSSAQNVTPAQDTQQSGVGKCLNCTA